MPRLLMLCPSRGRPARAREMVDTFLATRTEADLLVAVGRDDAAHDRYRQIIPPEYFESVPSTDGFVRALNGPATYFASKGDYTYLGFVGDDHRFRTPEWDRLFCDLLDERGGGIAYANDGNWTEGQLPTNVVMNAAIIRALGWMALPGVKHLYADNAWLAIGEQLGRAFFFPDILIEHLHPMFGGAAWDQMYRDTNTPETYTHDREIFETWLASCDADIERVREALT